MAEEEIKETVGVRGRADSMNPEVAEFIPRKLSQRSTSDVAQELSDVIDRLLVDKTSLIELMSFSSGQEVLELGKRLSISFKNLLGFDTVKKVL